MPDYSDEDIKSFIAGLTDFIDSFVVPLQNEHRATLTDPRSMYEPSGRYAVDVQQLITTVRTEAANAGYFTAFCPAGIGGAGLGYGPMLLVYEALLRRYGPNQLLVGATLAHWATGPSFLCEYFSPDIRATVLPELLSGSASACFAMSEPDAGSDAWMMRTRAERAGSDWIINGTKQWITGSPYAAYAYVFAVTDADAYRERKGGVTCFLVPTDAPGFRLDSVIKLFGEIGGNEGIISFSDLRIPDGNVVGAIDQGFRLAMRGVSVGRVYNSGRALGLAQWALAIACDHARTRRTFGKTLSEHEGISFKLAESAMEIFAGRYAALELARRLDAGKRATAELAITKAMCTETLLRVTDRCMQVCGAMGLTNEMGLYSAWHIARQLQLADGSAEILRRTVARHLLLGEFSI